MVKKFKIFAYVRKSHYHTPEEEVKDMLRYDRGYIIRQEETNNIVVLEIISEYYTKARWDSFLIKTELIDRV